MTAKVVKHSSNCFYFDSCSALKIEIFFLSIDYLFTKFPALSNWVSSSFNTSFSSYFGFKLSNAVFGRIKLLISFYVDAFGSVKMYLKRTED